MCVSLCVCVHACMRACVYEQWNRHLLANWSGWFSTIQIEIRMCFPSKQVHALTQYLITAQDNERIY